MKYASRLIVLHSVVERVICRTAKVTSIKHHASFKRLETKTVVAAISNDGCSCIYSRKEQESFFMNNLYALTVLSALQANKQKHPPNKHNHDDSEETNHLIIAEA